MKAVEKSSNKTGQNQIQMRNKRKQSNQCRNDEMKRGWTWEMRGLSQGKNN